MCLLLYLFLHLGRLETLRSRCQQPGPPDPNTRSPARVQLRAPRLIRRAAAEPGSSFVAGSRNGGRHVGKWFEPSDIVRAGDYGAYYYYPSYPGGFKAWRAGGRPYAFWTCCGGRNPAENSCAHAAGGRAVPQAKGTQGDGDVNGPARPPVKVLTNGRGAQLGVPTMFYT